MIMNPVMERVIQKAIFTKIQALLGFLGGLSILSGLTDATKSGIVKIQKGATDRRFARSYAIKK